MKLSKLMDSETLQVTWADPEDGGGGGGGSGGGNWVSRTPFPGKSKSYRFP